MERIQSTAMDQRVNRDQQRNEFNKNSSGDEIANVNFFYNIAHVEASAYAH